jgi:hypothetical protein
MFVNVIGWFMTGVVGRYYLLVNIYRLSAFADHIVVANVFAMVILLVFLCCRTHRLSPKG